MNASVGKGSGGSRKEKEDLPLLSWPTGRPSLPNSCPPLFSYLVTPPQNNCSSLLPCAPLLLRQHEMSVGAALVLTRGQGGPPCQSCSLGRSAPSASAWATPVNGRSDDSGGWDGGGAMGGLGCNGRGSVVRGHSLSPAASKKQFPRRRLPSFASFVPSRSLLSK